MTDSHHIEALDDDLRWLGRRLSRVGFDPSRTLRRRRLEEHRLLGWSVLLAAALVASVFVGVWHGVVALALSALPDAVGRWRAARAERSALADAEDFLEREKQNLAKRLADERRNAVFNVVWAAALAYASTTQLRGVLVFLWIAACCVLYGAWRCAVRVPALKRELDELGGKDEDGWILSVIFVAFFLALPVLLSLGLVWRGIQWLRGVEASEDERDDEEDPDEGAASSPNERRSSSDGRGGRK